jgi:hypothetical protein
VLQISAIRFRLVAVLPSIYHNRQHACYTRPEDGAAPRTAHQARQRRAEIIVEWDRAPAALALAGAVRQLKPRQISPVAVVTMRQHHASVESRCC